MIEALPAFPICELEFDAPDPRDPRYSRAEVDRFGHVPGAYPHLQHRLSLRKNLITGEFEYYAFFFVDGREAVVKHGAFAEVLKYGNERVREVWGDNPEFLRHVDVPCDHHRVCTWTCPKARRLAEA